MGDPFRPPSTRPSEGRAAPPKTWGPLNDLVSSILPAPLQTEGREISSRKTLPPLEIISCFPRASLSIAGPGFPTIFNPSKRQKFWQQQEGGGIIFCRLIFSSTPPNCQAQLMGLIAIARRSNLEAAGRETLLFSLALWFDYDEAKEAAQERGAEN